MLKETLPPGDKSEKVVVTAARIFAKEISAQALERVAGITGSLALLAGQQKEGSLARLTKGLLQTATDLRREVHEIFPNRN